MNVTSAPTQVLTGIAPWIHAARPKTLPAGIAPVLLGCAIAWDVGGFQIVPALLCLCFALLVQIGCNYANDYFDYKNGVDTVERVGFKRAVASGMITPEAMYRGMIVTLALAFFVGCGLIAYGGWWLLAVGVGSIICAVCYTAGPFPIGYSGLGDVFVFLFFGIVAVVFTAFVQVGFFSEEMFWVATGCGLLAANIRLVNDTRDRETDAKAGKKTLPVRFGVSYSHKQYLFSCVGAFIVPVVLVVMGYSYWVFLPMVMLPVALTQCVAFIQCESGADYNRHLAKTAQFLLAYAVLLAAGIVVS